MPLGVMGMDLRDILGGVILAAMVGFAVWRFVFRGPDAFRDAYRQAQQDDIDWVREHPGCTLEEAHQHREAVKKKFHRD